MIEISYIPKDHCAKIYSWLDNNWESNNTSTSGVEKGGAQCVRGFAPQYFLANLTSWVPLCRHTFVTPLCRNIKYFCHSPVPQYQVFTNSLPLARVSTLIHLCLPRGRGWGIPGDSVSSVTRSLHWSHDHTAITWHTFSPWYAFLYKFKMASTGHLGFLTEYS